MEAMGGAWRPAVHTVRCHCAILSTPDHPILTMDTHTPVIPAPSSAPNAGLPFPIVGIGASAGGFAALATLLQHLPPSPGMALVVVLHLPGDQHSNADRILQRSTTLPVV